MLNYSIVRQFLFRYINPILTFVDQRFFSRISTPRAGKFITTAMTPTYHTDAVEAAHT